MLNEEDKKADLEEIIRYTESYYNCKVYRIRKLQYYIECNICKHSHVCYSEKTIVEKGCYCSDECHSDITYLEVSNTIKSNNPNYIIVSKLNRAPYINCINCESMIYINKKNMCKYKDIIICLYCINDPLKDNDQYQFVGATIKCKCCKLTVASFDNINNLYGLPYLKVLQCIDKIINGKFDHDCIDK
jgi:hypothetical protein